MQFLYEFFPVFLFFLAFKFYGMYVATVVGIVTTFLQVVLFRLFKGRWDRKQVITLAIFVVFGGMTLYFHDPIFVKWKPTIIFWIFALLIMGSQLFTKKTMMQRLMENMMKEKGEIPSHAWKTVNLIWGFFFLILGGINLYVAYNCSNDDWVNFKFYGITGALFVLSIFQAFYLMRYLNENKS